VATPIRSATPAPWRCVKPVMPHKGFWTPSP